MNFIKILISILILNRFLLAGLSIDVKTISPQNPRLYEKIEIELTLQNAAFTNPFNSNEIDVMGFFTSPGDSTWKIFGFYDNYQTANAWKIRFAANEIGSWSFTACVINHGDTAWSPEYAFDVDSSEYHGWIRVSERNPHYFEYDDGTPFYGVGAYYPWGVSNGSNGLELLQNSGANIFGYWNIMYGDEKGIIESLNSGIGRYDQTKCGRIDQVLQWAEERNLKIMLAIWPHDLLSNTVWSHQWHNNPYKYICSAEDFYASEEAWQYQQQQYRYIIARWGYSRALAIWEIVNEINGTDGWQRGHEQEATQWVKKVKQFFKTNDPHQRPCTASQSGGIYWQEGYQIVDVPNVHLYETEWSAPFPGNPLRSSGQLYYDIASQLWKDFEKPAILGEAGYLNTFGGFAVPSPEYTQLYHNALWAGWAGGYATTPFWWSFTSRNIMSLEVMNQLKAFSKIARLIDYPDYRFEPFNEIQNEVDIYAQKSADLTFGWARQSSAKPIAGKVIRIADLTEKDTVFSVTLFNTWNGEKIGTQYVPTNNGQLVFPLPEDGQQNPDQAFIIKPVHYGAIPEKLKLFTAASQLFAADTNRFPVYCYIIDQQEQIVKSNLPVHFQLLGAGRLIGENPVQAQNGMATIWFQSTGKSGTANIFATTQKLLSDTLSIILSNEIWIDRFEEYASDIALNSAWQVRGGTNAELLLEQTDVLEGKQCLRVNYAIGNGNAYYAGFFKTINSDFTGADVLSFWLKDDNSQRDLILVARDTSGAIYQFSMILNHPDWQLIRIPFSHFNLPGLSSANLAEIAFNVLAGSSTNGQGWLKLDALSLQTSATALSEPENQVVNEFKLFPIYPNPFNEQALVRWHLPEAGKVQLLLFNLLGEKCATILDGFLPAGDHAATLNGNRLASGIYFLQLKMNRQTITQKLVLIK